MKKLSPGEELFARHCEALGIEYEREVNLIPGRKWRFDFVIRTRKKMFAVEIDGGTAWGKSRHSYGQGYENDARKINTASIMGICVLRFTTDMVRTGEAIDTVKQAIHDYIANS